MSLEPEEPPASRSARRTREVLGEALSLLAEAPDRSNARLAEQNLLTALRSLHQFDSATNPNDAERLIRETVQQLGRALSVLDNPGDEDRVELATEQIARALALLYPVARTRVRRRRDNAPESDPLPLPLTKRTQQSGGSPRHDAPRAGSEQRGSQRTVVEAQIGLLSESHFFTGLSLDLSEGGLFIATYQPLAPKTEVALFFGLPDGRQVEADGVVRWTRGAGPDTPPGMGVAFQRIDPEDLAAIAAFCRERAPLYHDAD